MVSFGFQLLLSKITDVANGTVSLSFTPTAVPRCMIVYACGVPLLDHSFAGAAFPSVTGLVYMIYEKAVGCLKYRAEPPADEDHAGISTDISRLSALVEVTGNTLALMFC